ncbi:unnamed protein product [Amoebophrya sp. A120]|nr:unnamed protein product [Amoebophrya sp. A120]|eukprot:GSA120T00008623001.1
MKLEFRVSHFRGPNKGSSEAQAAIMAGSLPAITCYTSCRLVVSLRSLFMLAPRYGIKFSRLYHIKIWSKIARGAC